MSYEVDDYMPKKIMSVSSRPLLIALIHSWPLRDKAQDGVWYLWRKVSLKEISMQSWRAFIRSNNSPKGNIKYPLDDGSKISTKVKAGQGFIPDITYIAAEGSFALGSFGIYSPGTPIPPVGRTMSTNDSRTAFGWFVVPSAPVAR